MVKPVMKVKQQNKRNEIETTQDEIGWDYNHIISKVDCYRRNAHGFWSKSLKVSLHQENVRNRRLGLENNPYYFLPNRLTMWLIMNAIIC